MIYMKNMSQLLRQSWYVDSGLVVWPLASIQINCRISPWSKAGHCLIYIFSEHQLVGEPSTGACESSMRRDVIVTAQLSAVQDDKY